MQNRTENTYDACAHMCLVAVSVRHVMTDVPASKSPSIRIAQSLSYGMADDMRA